MTVDISRGLRYETRRREDGPEHANPGTHALETPLPGQMEIPTDDRRLYRLFSAQDMTMPRTKIASRKKKKATTRDCPECGTEMEVTRVMRYSEGPGGMVWACTNTSCLTLVSKDGVTVGTLFD